MASHYLINNLEFSESRKTLSAELTLDQLQRLGEMLDPTRMHQSYAIHFELFGQPVAGKPGLRLKLHGKLPLLCQRCLAPLDWTLNIVQDFVLSEVELEGVLDEDETDWLAISREMDVTELIVDELILGLPLAPTHEVECHTGPMISGEKPNPFAVLKGKF